jgi:hypothetical protein
MPNSIREKLIAEAQKGEWVIEPVSGEELQSLAERIMVQPPDVVNQAKKFQELNSWEVRRGDGPR